MSRLINIKISPQAAEFVLRILADHIETKMQKPDALEYQQDISDLIAELRTLQKLKTAHAHHIAECECCDVS